MHKKIFISHSHKDQRVVEILAKLLRDIDSSTCVSYSSSRTNDSGIDKGENWEDWIDEKITECDFLIFLITPYYTKNDGKWLNYELRLARKNEKEILPLIFQINSDSIPVEIREIQFTKLDGRDDIKMFLSSIFDCINISSIDIVQNHISNFLASIQDQIKDYQRELKQHTNQSEIKFTQDDLFSFIGGPVGLGLKKGINYLKKRNL